MMKRDGIGVFLLLLLLLLLLIVRRQDRKIPNTVRRPIDEYKTTIYMGQKSRVRSSTNHDKKLVNALRDMIIAPLLRANSASYVPGA